MGSTTHVIALTLSGKVVGSAITARRFCKKVAGGWSQISATGDRPDGISMLDGAVGEEITFYVYGIHDVTSGAAITDGVDVMSDNAGKMVAFDEDAAGRWRAGVAWQAVSGANLSCAVLHHPHGPDYTA